MSLRALLTAKYTIRHWYSLQAPCSSFRVVSPILTASFPPPSPSPSKLTHVHATGIKNIGDSDAKLFFIQARKVPSEELALEEEDGCDRRAEMFK